MDKLTGMLGKAAGGDPGESLEQTMKEKAVEEMIEDKVESLAGKKVASSKQVQDGARQIADAVSDKVPTSMLASGMAGMSGMAEDGKSGSDDIMKQAGDLLGGSGGKKTDASDLMDQASDALGGGSDKKKGDASDLLDQASSFLGK